ncbi:hypothetical protein GCM10025859_58080 [Alicyclobacillus fastidiosus]|nr:hypothetical protein GCM10025859_58080 [Alicyclobacillus fastidiosus]
MLRNSLTRVLQIRYPIIQGGLAYVANGRLAAAVSSAGGLGQVGAAGRTPEAFREQIHVAKSLTDKPFGVNIPVSRHTDNSPYIQVALEEAANIVSVSLSAGDPRPFVPGLKAAGLKVLLVVATVRQARRAQEAGADILICEGFEAGGMTARWKTRFSHSYRKSPKLQRCQSLRPVELRVAGKSRPLSCLERRACKWVHGLWRPWSARPMSATRTCWFRRVTTGRWCLSGRSV